MQQVLKLNLANPTKDCFRIVSDYLIKNKLIIAPSDTIYGFLAIAENNDAINKINTIKQRDQKKPFIHLIPRPETIYRYCLEDKCQPLFDYWPGPLTIILNNKSGSTTAFRCPDLKFLQILIENVGSPLISTSVNLSGEKSVLSIHDIIAEYKNKVDLIIDAGETKHQTASTIVDATKKPFKIIRQGSLKVDRSLLS